MSAEDLPRNEATATVGDLMRHAAAAPPKPALTKEQQTAAELEHERLTRQMITDQRRVDSRRRYEMSCPREFRESDWAFPAIQPFRPQIDRVLGYADGPKGLLVSGPTGRRKTGAVWGLMRRLCCDDGLDVRFYSAFEFFAILQEQVRYGVDDARGWVEAVARRPRVFIDDLGQESLMQSREAWAQGWFFRFLDIRANEHLPLFVTTNLTGEEMAGRAGDLRGDPLIRRLLAVADPVPFETTEERAARNAR